MPGATHASAGRACRNVEIREPAPRRSAVSCVDRPTAFSPATVTSSLARALWLAAILLLSSATVPAAVPAAGEAAQGTSPVASSPVVVDGRPLFSVRGISALSADQRAGEIAARIGALARDPSFPASALRLEEQDDRTGILAGTQRVMAVFDADATFEGVDGHQMVGEIYLARIAAAIDGYRAERSDPYLRDQGLHALGALAVVAALLALVVWSSSRIAARIRRRFTGELEAVEARSYRLLTAEQLERTIEGLVRAVRWLLAFALLFAGAAYVLSLFPWTRGAAAHIAGLLVDPLRTLWQELLAAVPGLVFIVVLVVIARYLLRLCQVFFAGVASERIRVQGFAAEWGWPTYRLVRIAVIAFTVVIAYPYIPGSGSEAFKGVSIFFGLLMSLGAASAVANSLAGYALIYRRTFKVGDRIRVGELTGDVVEMRQQVTQLRTVKNEIVAIPSATMLTSQLTNYSMLEQGDGLILHTSVGIGYETPWRQVEAMLLLAAARTAEVKREPAPFVLLKSLADFAVVYELNAYCGHAQDMDKAYTALHRNILDVFNEFGVAIMTPAYVADPPDAKVVPRGKWHLAPASPDTSSEAMSGRAPGTGAPGG